MDIPQPKKIEIIAVPVMQQCPKCNERIAPELKVCPLCGYEIQ
jgi:uncharacterized OB-fold protein